MKKLMMLATTFAAFAASAAVTITDVSARQRWPWNGLVDIDFTIGGAAAGEVFAIDIDATAASGATSLSAKTYMTEPIANAGDNRVVWNLAADYPEFRANDLRISVTATPISSDKAIYMVIDLSGGSTATKYPVRYTTQAPAHVQGAANEPCQTTELWMRRIVPVSYAFTVLNYTVEESPTTDAKKRCYWGKMTKDYYVGVFEVTQKQYQLVMGEWPNSYFTNELYRASRPVEALRFSTFTGTWSDTQTSPSDIAAASFLGKIRAKTGLPINLPSHIQLNYAARGGTYLDTTTKAFARYAVNGEELQAWSELTNIGRFRNNTANESDTFDQDGDVSSGTAYVGSYLPNDYGLYDTLGNVREFTSELAYSSVDTPFREYYWDLYGDSTIGNTKANPIIDPHGITDGHSLSANNVVFRIVLHPSWIDVGASYGSTLWSAYRVDSSYVDGHRNLRHSGYRLSMTCE